MPLNGNHLSEGACYQHRGARDMAVLSLLRQAHKLMAQTTTLGRLSELEVIRDRGFPLDDLHRFAVSSDPPFLDAFRVGTSFENLFKAELLELGYVVHVIDPRAVHVSAKRLADEQKQRPVRVSEVRAIERSTWKRQGAFTIHCLQTQTLPFGRLLDPRKKYRRSLRLSKTMLQALETTREHRNTVHLLINDLGRYNATVVAGYRTMLDAFNTRFERRYAALIAKYEHLHGDPSLDLREI